MGRVFQTQRPAIEFVVRGITKESPRITFMPRTSYLLERDEMYLLGISNGVGTCSDLPDVDVAVFGTKQGDYNFVRPVHCQAAVLLRPREEGESDTEIQKELWPACLAIAGLTVTFKNSGSVQVRMDFKQTGKVKLYVPIVK